jgi:hypothetical protein
MKKFLLLTCLISFMRPVQAQESARESAGIFCVKTGFGGCYQLPFTNICTENIYYVKICCTNKPSFGTGYQACHIDTWTEPNPQYHRDGEAATGSAGSLQELVQKLAEKNKLSPDDFTSFTVKDAQVFTADDGNKYKVEAKTYKIDKSVPGWTLADILLIPYKP